MERIKRMRIVWINDAIANVKRIKASDRYDVASTSFVNIGSFKTHKAN